MNNKIASKSSLNVNCNLISVAKGYATVRISNETGVKQIKIYPAGSSSFSSNSDYKYDGTVTKFTEDILPSNISNITFRNPSGVTLTGKLMVTNDLYLLAGSNNKSSDNLTLSKSAATAVMVSAGYLVDTLSEIFSGSSESCSFAFGNSSIGNNIFINMITPEQD